MSRIPVVGIDPALRNMGIAIGSVELDTMEVFIDKVLLIKTEGDTCKTIRKNSDDLRRARLLCEAAAEHTKGAVMVFAEVPVGSQSARAMASYGICVGVMASIVSPMLEVTPSEVKVAATNCKSATKGEMIEWATEKYPDAPWLTCKRGGQKVFVADNEHLADAVAAIHAGVKTPEFKRSAALLNRV